MAKNGKSKLSFDENGLVVDGVTCVLRGRPDVTETVFDLAEWLRKRLEAIKKGSIYRRKTCGVNIGGMEFYFSYLNSIYSAGVNPITNNPDDSIQTADPEKALWFVIRKRMKA